MISTTEADWSREKTRQLWDPSRQLLGSIRRYQQYKRKTGVLALLRTKLAIIQYRFLSVITGADIPLTCQLGDDVLIGANSVVVKDVAPGLIVAGIPSKVIGNTGIDS